MIECISVAGYRFCELYLTNAVYLCAAVISANLVVQNHAKFPVTLFPNSSVPFMCWAAIHEDEDEKFDSSLFKVPLYHSGRFRLPNQVFTEDLTNLSSTKSQVLATNLQEKVVFFFHYNLYFAE